MQMMLSAEKTKSYIAFGLLGVLFFMIAGFFFVEIPKDNNNHLNTALGFIAGAMTSACGYYFGASESKSKDKQIQALQAEVDELHHGK